MTPDPLALYNLLQTTKFLGEITINTQEEEYVKVTRVSNIEDILQEYFLMVTNYGLDNVSLQVRSQDD